MLMQPQTSYKGPGHSFGYPTTENPYQIPQAPNHRKQIFMMIGGGIAVLILLLIVVNSGSPISFTCAIFFWHLKPAKKESGSPTTKSIVVILLGICQIKLRLTSAGFAFVADTCDSSAEYSTIVLLKNYSSAPVRQTAITQNRMLPVCAFSQGN